MHSIVFSFSFSAQKEKKKKETFFFKINTLISKNYYNFSLNTKWYKHNVFSTCNLS